MIKIDGKLRTVFIVDKVMKLAPEQLEEVKEVPQEEVTKMIDTSQSSVKGDARAEEVVQARAEPVESVQTSKLPEMNGQFGQQDVL